MLLFFTLATFIKYILEYIIFGGGQELFISFDGGTLAPGGNLEPGGNKMAGYLKVAGIWRRETNDSRRGIFFLAVKWNGPNGTLRHKTKLIGSRLPNVEDACSQLCTLTLELSRCPR